MSCISPIQVKNKATSDYVKVNCGQCIQCRIKKQSDLIFLSKKELLDVYRSGRGACFVTLTYDEDHLPYSLGQDGVLHNSIFYKDLKDFHKRLRRHLEYHNIKIPYRYLQCSEYGGQFGRSHYHIIFFGLEDSIIYPLLHKLWQFGNSQVGCLSAGGVQYVTKYCIKNNNSKEFKQMYEYFNIEPPHLYHSINFADSWIRENADSILANGFLYYNHSIGWSPVPKFVFNKVQSLTKDFSLKYSDLNLDYEKMMIKKLGLESLSAVEYSNWKKEQSYIKEMYMRTTLRSRGETFNPDDERSFVRPVVFNSYVNLARRALDYS